MRHELVVDESGDPPLVAKRVLLPLVGPQDARVSEDTHRVAPEARDLGSSGTNSTTTPAAAQYSWSAGTKRSGGSRVSDRAATSADMKRSGSYAAVSMRWDRVYNRA